MTELISTIKIGNKELNVIYNKQEYGLYNLYSSDDGIKTYITDYPEEALFNAINIGSDGTYVINIASVADFGAFEWKDNYTLLHRQLEIYMPIIQAFIEKVTTGKL